MYPIKTASSRVTIVGTPSLIITTSENSSVETADINNTIPDMVDYQIPQIVWCRPVHIVLKRIGAQFRIYFVTDCIDGLQAESG